MRGPTRRSLLRAGAAGVLTLGSGRRLFAQARPRLVVVGGGAGGCSLARFVVEGSAGAVEVALIEPKADYATCFHSNLYLGGLRDWASINHGYGGLEAAGVVHVRTAAAAVDREAKEVRLEDGGRVAYDHLALAPGIDVLFDRIPGYSPEAAEVMPHAWTAGPQTRLLRARLDALEDGALVVMVAPPNPYRCPPGPYERVSMMAHLLKSTGRGSCRIVVLDAKDSFSKQALFQQGWERHYPGMVEWQDPLIHGGVGAVDAATQTVETELADYRADLVNVIPPQAAGRVARDAGLADASGFCPVTPEAMRSTLDPFVTVLGDAAIAGDMPKSAFSANSQANVAAGAILAELVGGAAPAARYANTCWSVLAPGDAVKIGGRYAPRDGRIAADETFVSKPEEDAETRRETEAENLGWYEAITQDLFG